MGGALWRLVEIDVVRGVPLLYEHRLTQPTKRACVARGLNQHVHI